MTAFRVPLKQADPLMLATRGNDVATLEAELAVRYADEPPPDVLVALACREGLLESLNVLLARGARTGMLGALFGATPLHAAAANGRVVIVDRLLDHGVPVDLVDASGQTPLHDAINQNQVGMVDHLLARGADGHALQFRMGNTRHSALTYALVEKKLSDVAWVLIQHGLADAQGALDGQGNSPLHIGVREQWPDVVHALLDRGLPVDPQNRRQETPLKLAVQRGGEAGLANITLLMGYGANPTIVSDSGSSPLSLAQRMGGPVLAAMERAIMRRTAQTSQSGEAPLPAVRARARL